MSQKKFCGINNPTSDVKFFEVDIREPIVGIPSWIFGQTVFKYVEYTEFDP